MTLDEAIKGHINRQHQYWLAEDSVLWHKADTQALLQQDPREVTCSMS